MKAIIFPGQGSQYAGMGKSLYDNFSAAKNIFDSIDNVLGFELSKKCFQAQAEQLKDTAIQQLAILAVSVAAFEVFSSKGIQPDYLSGLSLGEYSCLYAARVVSLEDLVILVRERAKAMQQAAKVSSSTMFAVIGAEMDFLKEKSQQEDFYIANINSSSQVVVSLAKDIKDKVRSILEIPGVRVVELEVSGGFHSPFMIPAKDMLREVIRKIQFNDARIPIVSNFTARAHTREGEIKENLLEQLTSPVLWKECIEFMSEKGVNLFFEVGPAKVLRGLIRKINPKLKVVNIEKKEDLEQI